LRQKRGPVECLKLMVVKLLGVIAIVVGVAFAVSALLDVLVTPWVVIGMSLFGIALAAAHERRTVRIRKSDREVRLRRRAAQDGE
jgi:membrane protein implicated in regulation of membrane protease activity